VAKTAACNPKTAIMKFCFSVSLCCFLFFVVLSLNRCAIPESPAEPTWAVGFTVPVVNSDYTLQRFFTRANDRKIVVLPNGEVRYTYDSIFVGLVIPDSIRRLIQQGSPLLRDSLSVPFEINPIELSGFRSVRALSGDANPVLAISFINGLRVPHTLRARVVSVNNDRQTNIALRPTGQTTDTLVFRVSAPSDTLIRQYTKQNSNASDFVLNIPQDIRIAGRATIDTASIRRADTLTSRFRFVLDIPIALRLDTLLATDTAEITTPIDAQDIDSLRLDAVSENGTPLNFLNTVLLYRDSTVRVGSTTRTILIPIRYADGRAFRLPQRAEKLSIAAAPVNTSDSLSSGITTTTQTFFLNREEIRLLKTATRYTTVLEIDSRRTSVAIPVKIRNTDKLNFKIIASGRIFVNR
jgi:hypothetical protein